MPKPHLDLRSRLAPQDPSNSSRNLYQIYRWVELGVLEKKLDKQRNRRERDNHSPAPSPSSKAGKNHDDGNNELEEQQQSTSTTPTTVTRRTTQRQSTRQAAAAISSSSSSSSSSSKATDPPSRNNNNNNHDSLRGSKAASNGSTGSRTPFDQKQERNGSNSVSEDRDVEDASGESVRAEEQDDDEEDDDEEEEEGGDVESDEERQEKESDKGTRSTSTKAPSKRRLRSNKLQPNVVAHLSVDGSGLNFDQILDEYTEEQQQLRANTSAAEALVRLLRQGIQESESLHADMVDEPDYELIRHTFGDIEDLDLSLTGTMSVPDESSAEDDELTKELKRKHRIAKKDIHDVAAEYKAVRRRVFTQMWADLDAEEAQIRAGTHSGLLAELQAIEDRRKARIGVIQAERDYRQRMWESNFQAVCKAANDQYQAGQVTARKNIVDLVQSRMNRIKHELEHSNRVAARSAAKRKAHLANALKYRKPIFMTATEASAYESCDESCTSYDSYSSSGSECSDCNICKQVVPKRSGIPQYTSPQGLSRKEVALDLAFLFPEQSQRKEDLYDDLDELSSRGARNQQHMIDRLNDEKRRRRRVTDREMQNRIAYKKPPVLGRVPSSDMDLDHDLDSRPRSPTLCKASSSRLVTSGTRSRQTMDHQPRFLPGFGPEGLRRSDPSSRGSLPASRQESRYPNLDRYGRQLESPLGGYSGNTAANDQGDSRLVAMAREREQSRTRGARTTQEYTVYVNRNERRHHGPSEDPRLHPTAQQRYRPHEIPESPYRPRAVREPPVSGTHRVHPYAPSPYTLDPRAHPYENSVDFKPPRKRAPLPPDPNGYQTPPRGRTMGNNSAVSWAGPIPTFNHSDAAAAADKMAMSRRREMSSAKFGLTRGTQDFVSSSSLSSTTNGYGSHERLSSAHSGPRTHVSASLPPTYMSPREQQLKQRLRGVPQGMKAPPVRRASPVLIDLSSDQEKSPVLVPQPLPSAPPVARSSSMPAAATAAMVHAQSLLPSGASPLVQPLTIPSSSAPAPVPEPTMRQPRLNGAGTMAATTTATAVDHIPLMSTSTRVEIDLTDDVMDDDDDDDRSSRVVPTNKDHTSNAGNGATVSVMDANTAAAVLAVVRTGTDNADVQQVRTKPAGGTDHSHGDGDDNGSEASKKRTDGLKDVVMVKPSGLTTNKTTTAEK
ncbi:hypothetical protein BGX28_010015 [Mortierella sp. GBA30]|nr:hypothetical protein BGX28_010015 [Mortierella sp. GBA30]